MHHSHKDMAYNWTSLVNVSFIVINEEHEVVLFQKSKSTFLGLSNRFAVIKYYSGVRVDGGQTASTFCKEKTT